MTPDRAAERAAYIAAFIEANGSSPDFTLDWENGWWVFGYRDGRPVRYRSRVLREMRERLRATAAEQRR